MGGFTPMRLRVVIVRIVATAIVATAAAAGAKLRAQDPTFRTEVDVVRATVTVIDRAGRFVTGLTKQDFSVFEDGQARDVLRVVAQSEPVSLGILLDTSGSMTADKVRLARTAIARLVADGLRSSDQWFLARFGFSLAVVMDWTNERDAIVQPLREVTHTTGDTALYDAVVLAIPLAESGKFEKKSLLVVSDGGETKSLLSLDMVTKAIGADDVRVYAIGVGSSDGRRGDRLDMKPLRRLADETGGRAEAVSDSQSAQLAADRIADELRNQYSVAFATNAHKDGRVHSIRVSVHRPGAAAKARKRFG
jgi:Ca-activated chloride channel family protein